jgi:hypothetical protein
LIKILDLANKYNVLGKCDPKMVEIKTLEIIKKAGNGIGSCFYMTLPVFLSKLPVAGFSLVDEKEE